MHNTSEPRVLYEWPAPLRWLDRPALVPETAFRGHVVALLLVRFDCAHSRVAAFELASAVASAKRLDDPIAFVVVRVEADEWGDSGGSQPQMPPPGDGRQTLPFPAVTACTTSAALRQHALHTAALPQLVLLDAEGRVAANSEGVPRRRRARDAITSLLRAGLEGGQLASVPFAPVGVAAVDPAAGPLATDRYPLTAHAVCVHGEGEDRSYWFASPQRAQVMRFDAEGRCTLTVGSGATGQQDGPPATASFVQPHALCAHEHLIVVADGMGQALRSIDAESGTVETICGNGQLGSDPHGGGYGRDQALASPHGLVSRDGGLFVCMAGTDQIWQVDPMTGAAMAWLGGAADSFVVEGGDVALRDFVQPVAIAGLDDDLWVCESGAVSVVGLAHVERRDFAQGLQQPAAVCVVAGRVLVADAGAGCVLSFDPETGERLRCAGPEHGLVEPVSLAHDGERLLICDAGRGLVLAMEPTQIDREGGEEALAEWELHDVPAAPPAEDLEPSDRPVIAQLAEPIRIHEFTDVAVHLELSAEHGVPDGSSASIEIVDEAAATLACERDTVAVVEGGEAVVLVPTEAAIDGGAWRIRLRVGSLHLHYVVPVEILAAGAEVVTIRRAGR
ncbi:MAG: hypothetical protein AB8H80_01150 [Planctomycetota bacterium]